jgi:AraC-like DNA-binding protein
MQDIEVFGIEVFSDRHSATYFYSSDLKTHLESHKFINIPHRHSTYVAVLFTQGSGIHQVDFESFEVKSGSIFLLRPGQVHCWNLSEDADGYIFFHTGEFYNQIFQYRKLDIYPFFQSKSGKPIFYLSAYETLNLSPLFSQIDKEFHDAKSDAPHKIGLLVDLIYIELSRLYKTETDPKQIHNLSYSKIKILQKLIDENFSLKKLPGQYAEMMHISTRHLSRICQESLGKTTQSLIYERVFLEAKRLLVHVEIPISVVSEKLGFADPSYFIRQFKKQTGVSPKAFQQKIKTGIWK